MPPGQVWGFIQCFLSLSGPRVTAESSIWTDKGNGTGNFVDNVLDGMVTASAAMKEAGADKTVFQGSNQLSGVRLISIRLLHFPNKSLCVPVRVSVSTNTLSSMR